MEQAISKSTLLSLHEQMKEEKKISAIIVVRSKRSGRDFTYKLKSSHSPVYGYSVFASMEISHMEFISVAVGSPWDGARLFKKHRGTTSMVILGAAYLLNMVCKGDIDSLLESAEVFHTGKCLKCSRTLTDLESIEIGIGPVCRNM